MIRSLHLATPIGPVTLTATDEAVIGLRFGTAVPEGSLLCSEEEAGPLLREAAAQLREYFAGARRAFTLPLAPAGTEFQQRVWKALRTIPCGETRTYKQIAEQIGHDRACRACRAVGMANNRNPIAILIPCHRVIGHDGGMTGYAAGIGIKEQLLNLEKKR